MRSVFSQTVKLWKVKFTCYKCGGFTTFILSSGRKQEIQTRSEAYKNIPSSGFNGWNIAEEGKELCPSCAAQHYMESLNKARVKASK